MKTHKEKLNELTTEIRKSIPRLMELSEGCNNKINEINNKHKSEVYIPVVGFEDRYEISNYGNIRTLNRLEDCKLKNSPKRTIKQKQIKLCENKNGYYHICLRKNSKIKTIEIHRLVYMCFISIDYLPNYVLDHIDGIRTNNKLTNLQVITQSENVKKGINNINNRHSKHDNIIYDKIRDKWRVIINGKFIGRYKTEELAIIEKNKYITSNSNILLNDVLEWHSLNGRCKYSHFEVSKGEAYFSIYDGEENESINWDLSKLKLSDQSEELINFLHDLIPNK